MPSSARKWIALVPFLLLGLSACGDGGLLNPSRPPEAIITADPPSGTVSAPATVVFDASDSTGAIDNYQWYVDGVLAGSGPELARRFDTAGVHSVRLVIAGNTGEGEATIHYTLLAQPAFQITLVFEEGTFSPAEQAMMRAAADRWEQLVLHGTPPNSELPKSVRDSCLAVIGPSSSEISPELRDVDLFDGLLVFVRHPHEESNHLGWGGPCYWGSRLPNYGFVLVNDFNLDSLVNHGALTQLMTHELGHVLGLGTLWRPRSEQLLRPGPEHCNNTSLEPGLLRTYKGPGAVAEYQVLGGEGEPPVDASCTHWHEETFGNEMITPNTLLGDAASNPDPVSRMTLGALTDLGYTVDMEQADDYSLPTASAGLQEAPDLYRHGVPFVVLPGGPSTP